MSKRAGSLSVGPIILPGPIGPFKRDFLTFVKYSPGRPCRRRSLRVGGGGFGLVEAIEVVPLLVEDHQGLIDGDGVQVTLRPDLDQAEAGELVESVADLEIDVLAGLLLEEYLDLGVEP